jgi:hypothetical protein
MPDAGSTNSKEYIDYKTYSLYLLDFNYKEYKCLTILWGKESAWNPAAIGNLNSTDRVYGIPQGKSEWLATQDGWSQVRWGLDYIGSRYYEPCLALQHWRTFNWY